MTTARKKVQAGAVALVAAGPGDPDLITLRAAAHLRAADVIITDADAEPVAQAHARPEASIVVATEKSGAPLDHADRARLVIDAAREGKDVVRLICGDPVIDGTLLHEASALRKA
ncbi:MAG: SAM-dependent methyltransferase, partial [Actinomycetales bacterium]